MSNEHSVELIIIIFMCLAFNWILKSNETEDD